MHQRVRAVLILASVLALGLGVGPAAGEPLARSGVPAPLEPWVDWVLRGHEEQRCPFLNGIPERRPCAWPARLALDLGDRSGRFVQHWLVLQDAAVPLPGDTRRWPLDVRANGEKVPVVSVAGRPSARLEPGRYRVSGAFRWDGLPELLQIPPETGIVGLTLRGAEIAFPKRDAQGRLWLLKRAGGESDGDAQRLEVSVHRRVVDDIPLRLDTRMRLQVAGRSRELLLGRALPEGFVPLALSSPLPARLDPDGRLRVQVRPGTWTISLEARHEGPVHALTLLEPDGPWDPSEVWVFDARPSLRLVRVEDGQSVDPAQTTLPDEWKHLPAYLMEPGHTLRLVEKRRGNADPAPDALSLSRVLWMDFDGGGYTVSDTIDGIVRRSTRLEVGPATELGRAALGDRDQLITRLDGSALSGIEVPQGRIRLSADSRVAANGDGLLSRQLSAVSWEHDFQSLSGRLHLPPGWRLLHASGVDRASPTWIGRWTLLDLFAVVLLALAFFHLWGARWGALALIGLALTYTEPGAPRWVWVAVLAGEALRRVLPAGRLPRLRRGVELARLAALGLLVLIAVPFAVGQVRSGLFPTLERPRDQVHVPTPDEIAQLRALGYADDELDAQEKPLEQKAGRLARSVAEPSTAEYAARSPSLESFLDYAPDPRARITTGPGLPAWEWRTVTLQWSGPVERSQMLRLVLVPPVANGVAAFARVALLAALVLCALGVSAAGTRRWLRPGATAAVTLALLGLAAPEAARADIPSQQLLDELRQRLLENPDCHPQCAASPRLVLDAGPRALRVRLEIDAAAETAVPLPGGARSWTPQTVLVDGEPAAGLLRTADGTLWVQLAAGRHQLVAEGALPDRDSIELPLPLRPHHVEARAKGWNVHGVHEDGVAEQNLQLTRIRAEGDAGDDALEPGELPPFVGVERSIRLGLEWQVQTTVTRLSPADTALVLELALLPGESITTAGIRAEDGHALVTMGPGVTRASWSSLLAQRAELVLRAPGEAPATEVWRLDVSPVWHVDASGIPTIHQASPDGARIREWRPWPGEQVVLHVTRPAGVEGATTTIDAAALELRPGLRATDATLAVTLRSSRGGQHEIRLPEGAALQRVAIDGAEQPIRQEDRSVSVPLRPGPQHVEFDWREPRGARTLLLRGSEVDLGLPSVNTEVRIAPSRGRWTLLAGGPRLGPAILFWPLLVVVAVLALGLGRLSASLDLTPLRFRHWLLLGVGLTQVPIPAAALVVGWLLALGWRRRSGTAIPGRGFDLLQLALAGLTLLALVVLFAAIREGLLGSPAMQIAGNGSTADLLRWYQDRADARLPQPWIASVPLVVYRLAMLAWALWLARALVAWLRWGWACFSAGELWRPVRRARVAEGPASS